MLKSIYFSGAHFYRLQYAFDQRNDIEDTRVGYLNGTKAFPTYDIVKQGDTSATLCVKVIFDPDRIDVHELVDIYLDCIDIHADTPNYMRKGIYYDDLLDAVEAEIALVEHVGKDHGIEILKCCNFFPAETVHQHYLRNHPEEIEAHNNQGNRS